MYPECSTDELESPKRRKAYGCRPLVKKLFTQSKAWAKSIAMLGFKDKRGYTIGRNSIISSLVLASRQEDCTCERARPSSSIVIRVSATSCQMLALLLLLEI